ncbi:cell division transport system permease protein [Gracilibacillus halotolerans]|uniref:Cell division protein FtsX n=1 Tax=Gracilibacillus halotolerans TaxID=74386 RepID=A0A841RE79_9BACI|nr:permease-like cell division protein FtsX [Gracilibacillus halotolerans]MBB6512310.1 cell division transport system permease protein [Gracilibacillus halotolerans]
MKFRTLKRHFKEGIKNTLRNGWMTVASVGAVTTTLILVSVFLVVMLNINHIADGLENDVEIKVLIDFTAEQADKDNLEQEIRGLQGIDSIEYSTKEEELKKLMESMGEQGGDWALYEQDNPLNDAFIIKAENPHDTGSIAAEIEQMDHIYRVNYGQDYVDILFTFNQYVRNIGMVLIAALVFTAIFLISNTIKITILAREKEIGIMKLVGATNSFIRWPFFVEGMLLGVLGSLLPIIIVLTGYYFLTQNVEMLQRFSFVQLLPFYPFAFQIAGLIIGIGVVIGVWGSLMSVRKFLRV